MLLSLFCHFFAKLLLLDSFLRQGEMIFGVPRREKPLLFQGFPCFFFQKKQGLEGQGCEMKSPHLVDRERGNRVLETVL